MPRSRPSDHVRARLRELLQQAQITQVALCRRLAERTQEPWPVTRLSKILNGHMVFRVDDLVLMCEEAHMSLVEVVRQPGREFVGDLTPSELKVIDLIREQPERAANIIALLPPRRASYRAELRARQARIKARMQRREDD